MGCNANKQIQLQQKNKEDINIIFYSYRENEGIIVLQKKILLKNPYLKFFNVRINYVRNGEIMPSIFSYPMEYNVKKKKYTIIADKGELYNIVLHPLNEREIIYKVQHKFNLSDKKFNSLISYFNLSEVIDLNLNTKGYQEPFSEFKRKNSELLEFLTKGDSIELEVLSPVKQKYKFKAEW